MTRYLDVYFKSTKTGILGQDTDGTLTFAHDAEYLQSGGAGAISFSMPLREEHYSDQVTRPFFSGLLPDEGARQRLAGALGLSSGNAFGLLEVIGGECAGALSLYHTGEAPAADDDKGVEELTSDIGLAKGGRQTTHILKPVIQGLEGIVENELFCLRLADRLNLPVPAVEMRWSGETAFLLIERYDRARTADGRIDRLHQEDFCQALSIPPELKYEEEGDPGTERSIDLINRAVGRPAADGLRFIRMLLLQCWQRRCPREELCSTLS